MKKIINQRVVLRYVAALVLIMCGVFALVFSPEMYAYSNYNFGPVLAFVLTGVATLVYNSVDD